MSAPLVSGLHVQGLGWNRVAGNGSLGAAGAVEGRSGLPERVLQTAGRRGGKAAQKGRLSGAGRKRCCRVPRTWRPEPPAGTAPRQALGLPQVRGRPSPGLLPPERAGGAAGGRRRAGGEAGGWAGLGWPQTVT